MKRLFRITLLFLVGSAFAQHAGGTLEDAQTLAGGKSLRGTTTLSTPLSATYSDSGKQTISGDNTFSGTTTIGNLCRSTNGEIDVVACYGADPTGTNDSTTALNEAFATPSNNTRYIPSGTYKISGTLNIDTRYRVLGEPNKTVIQAASGFRGIMADIVSTYAQTSFVLGGMDGLYFECDSNASVGILYGGSGTYTIYGYSTRDTEIRHCTTANAQVRQNAWELSWYNVGFNNGGTDGIQVLDQSNMGENLNCHSCDISNNAGNGVTMGPSTHGFTHHFNCFACSFDYNGAWAIQNQTATTGESIVTLEGGQIETVSSTEKWIQNYGRLTGNGLVAIVDSGTAPTYVLDNENYFTANGGRYIQGPATNIFNASQTGNTSCISAVGLQTMCASYVDPQGYYASSGGYNNWQKVTLAMKAAAGSEATPPNCVSGWTCSPDYGVINFTAGRRGTATGDILSISWTHSSFRLHVCTVQTYDQTAKAVVISILQDGMAANNSETSVVLYAAKALTPSHRYNVYYACR